MSAGSSFIAAWIFSAIFPGSGASVSLHLDVGFVHASELKTSHAALWVLFAAVCVSIASLEHARPPVLVADITIKGAGVAIAARAAVTRLSAAFSDSRALLIG